MKIVALVSGGKDSCYSMMKCVAHGHQIVALANLHPHAHVGEELDSWMYQTVGHSHVMRIAEAMELPLFRREIRGKAVEQGLRYTAAATQGDEVEDLHVLLSEVLAAHPDIGGVCSGAILSNYQRSRVESVCARLGLASLAFLWQREQAALLDEMVGAGIEAVLVKVASLGLTSNHLGKSLGMLRPHFEKLEQRGFGFHVCGEGGEYETFTLDCPLFRRRLRPVGEARVITHGGGAALLSWESIELEDKEDGASAAFEPVPTSHGDVDVCGEIGASTAALESMAPFAAGKSGYVPSWTISMDGAAEAAGATPPIVRVVELGGGLLQLATHGGSGVGYDRTPSGEAQLLSAAGSSAAASQLTAALEAIRAALIAHELSLSDVLLLRLYVASMADYKVVNAAFSAVLGTSVPAARVAVELPLPHQSNGPGTRGDAGGESVALECVAWRGEKQLLHVQSISEWAPRMIGPYAQLTSGLGVAYVAGCIALIPSEMSIVGGGAGAQTLLALKNCEAVLRGVSLSPAGALSLVIYLVDGADAPAVQTAAMAWLRRTTGGESTEVGGASTALPPLLLLQVGALPMGSLVEAQLEASATSSVPPLLCEDWPMPAFGGVGVHVASTVASAAPTPMVGNGAGGQAASGVAHCMVSATDETASSLTAGQIGAAIAAAAAQIDERLRTRGHALGDGIYARILYDSGCIPVGRAKELEEAVCAAITAGGTRQCSAFAIPVVRVIGLASGQRAAARLAVQLHFTAVETADISDAAV